VAAQASPRATAFATAYGLALALLLGVPNEDFGSADHLLRILVVACGGGLATWIAWSRDRTQRREERATFIAEAVTRLDASLDYETTAQSLARLAVPWLGA
jgi:hypothetical protein